MDVVCKQTGKPILKPWTIYADDQNLINHLNAFTCDKSHEHAPCAGSNTNATGFYTTKFANTILDGWQYPQVGVTAALPCLNEPDAEAEATNNLPMIDQDAKRFA